MRLYFNSENSLKQDIHNKQFILNIKDSVYISYTVHILYTMKVQIIVCVHLYCDISDEMSMYVCIKFIYMKHNHSLIYKITVTT